MNNQNFYSFESLEVWKSARELRKRMSDITKSFPNEEKYRLIDQIIRASRSVAANIAEGFGRFHHQENIQFCRQARGSLFEVIEHLLCAFDEKYINENTLIELRATIDDCLKKLNGYIAYLQKAKERDKNNIVTNNQ